MFTTKRRPTLEGLEDRQLLTAGLGIAPMPIPQPCPAPDAQVCCVAVDSATCVLAMPACQAPVGVVAPAVVCVMKIEGNGAQAGCGIGTSTCGGDAQQHIDDNIWSQCAATTQVTCGDIPTCTLSMPQAIPADSF